MQLSHIEQCEARGGLNILQVKQYFNLTVSPLTWTSLVRGGLRKLAELCVRSTLSVKFGSKSRVTIYKVLYFSGLVRLAS